jgi:hypothetical protein
MFSPVYGGVRGGFIRNDRIGTFARASNIKSFNNAAQETPFLVLTDLDNAQCPPSLINAWLPHGNQHPNLIFRVAVREVEAWLLADRNNFADYLGILKEKIPPVVESIKDPKRLLMELARKSRKRALREAIVPSSKSGAKQGPDYNGALIPFVNKFWDIEAAKENSMSLKKTVKAVRNFKPAA